MKTKALHFAGYDFTSGPGGTVVARGAAPLHPLQVDDRVKYTDVNLYDTGVVEAVAQRTGFMTVRWDRTGILSTEWASNLMVVERRKQKR